jgi:hypothetical protein
VRVEQGRLDDGGGGWYDAQSGLGQYDHADVEWISRRAPSSSTCIRDENQEHATDNIRNLFIPSLYVRRTGGRCFLQ